MGSNNLKKNNICSLDDWSLWPTVIFHPGFGLRFIQLAQGLISGLVNLLISPTAIGKISDQSHHWEINNAGPTYINHSFHKSSIHSVHSYSWLSKKKLFCLIQQNMLARGPHFRNRCFQVTHFSPLSDKICKVFPFKITQVLFVQWA